jgi:ubiquinone/menaquinone biosynthesis C-methylase UbiE
MLPSGCINGGTYHFLSHDSRYNRERMTETLSQVQAGYDRWSAIYDHDANPLQALEGSVVRALLGDPGGLAALDLGCGTGRHAIWLATQGAVVTAVDFSEGMLAQARSKTGAEKVRFLQHDLHKPLPFEPAMFDVVVSGLVLEHLRDLRQFFGEVHRVLKPNGNAVVSSMHPAMFLKGTQARFTDPSSGELVKPGSIPHSISDFILAALHSGFDLVDAKEMAVDEAFAVKNPRAERYVGWPMLFVMSLKRK